MKAMLHKTTGRLPDLEIDLDAPPMLAVSSAAAQLAKLNPASELALTATSEFGEMPIPVLCTSGNERWVPYIETETWNSEAIRRFVAWMAVIRTTTYSDVHVQIYSRDPVPPLVAAVLPHTPLARFQLEGFLRCQPFEFAINAKLLAGLSGHWLQTPLEVQADALQVLEVLITRCFGSATPLPALGTTVHLLGCFTGEALRQRFGCQWVKTANPGFRSGWALSLPSAELNPMGKAEKRIVSGCQESLWQFYLAIEGALKSKR